MLRNFDFSSWQAVLTTVIGIALFAFIGIGIRLLVMQTIQQRQQRLNRQINERLRTLIAAYKVLGGSFTGNLSVDPRHMRDAVRAPTAAAEAEAAAAMEPAAGIAAAAAEAETTDAPGGPSERGRQIRDAVEAALSDIILLGTEEHVRLAERAARDLVDGRAVHTHELVVSLRDFIRKALDLDAIPADIAIPMQGPTRPSGGGRGGRGGGEGDRQGGAGRGGGGGGAGGGGGGAGMGMGMGLGGSADDVATPPTPRT